MMVVRSLLLAGIILLYGYFFSLQEQKREERHVSLTLALPVNFYKIAAGYMRQLASEMLFIRTIVFIGGVQSDTLASTYEESLATNFEVMTKIYPRFIDPYYFSQAFLAPISPEAAAKASTIFEIGIAAHPDALILRFFHGTNFFLAMKEPLRAAEVFAEATRLPEAPPMFGHLAALLSAQGGDITAGLISLKTLLSLENDDKVRIRYEEEIAIFEQALEVQKSLNAYIGKYGAAPHTLKDLVPEFIESIPEIKDSLVLVYDPPTVHLQRPDGKSKTETTGVR